MGPLAKNHQASVIEAMGKAIIMTYSCTLMHPQLLKRKKKPLSWPVLNRMSQQLPMIWFPLGQLCFGTVQAGATLTLSLFIADAIRSQRRNKKTHHHIAPTLFHENPAQKPTFIRTAVSSGLFGSINPSYPRGRTKAAHAAMHQALSAQYPIIAYDPFASFLRVMISQVKSTEIKTLLILVPAKTLSRIILQTQSQLPFCAYLTTQSVPMPNRRTNYPPIRIPGPGL